MILYKPITIMSDKHTKISSQAYTESNNLGSNDSFRIDFGCKYTEKLVEASLLQSLDLCCSSRLRMLASCSHKSYRWIYAAAAGCVCWRLAATSHTVLADLRCLTLPFPRWCERVRVATVQCLLIPEPRHSHRNDLRKEWRRPFEM